MSDKDKRIAELEEIETDLNNTIGFMERGITEWEAKATTLEAELAEHEWIAVEDRLPEENGQYLLAMETGTVKVCYKPGEHVIDAYHFGCQARYATHWKPITLPR